jgi:hypothetical protein
MNYNNLTIKAYTSGTTETPNSGLEYAQDVQFQKVYPGGLCAGMTFYIPRDVVSTWTVKGGQRIAAWNGLTMVWEGWIVGIAPTLSASTQGYTVMCEGAWAHYLMTRKTLKPWADTRTDEQIWAYTPAIAVEQKCSVSRSNNVITFEPRSTRDASGNENGWATNDTAQVVYTAPTGQTFKRITAEYDLQEGAQNWSLFIYCGTNLLTVTTSNPTPGTMIAFDSSTMASPDPVITMGLIAGADQLPATDGTMYASFGSIVAYTELGSINAQEIAKDIAGTVTELSTDQSQIGALTLSLVPFYANGAETYADLLTRAASFGDASFNRWACYVGLSQDVSDNLPRLILEQVAALTDYDYAVRMDDPNVSGDIAFMQDIERVRNWIAVQYNDEDGRTVYVTPDDDANLTDATSVSAYGRREEWITLPTSDLTAAKNYARRYLAEYKDPQWTCTGQLVVSGYINAKTGAIVPASEIIPGKRVKIQNWLNDLSGTGLTLLISGSTYNDTDETCAIDFGKPDSTEVVLARMQRDAEITRGM